MTQAQVDAINQVHQLLAEHFDGSVISVSAENGDDSFANHIRVPSGDAFTALGLLEAARHQLLMHGHQVVIGMPPDIE